MNCKIDYNKTQGCDKISKAYCDNFNALRPLYVTDKNVAVLGNIQIDLNNMDVFDRSALGLYIGKFVEQEINSSVVQLMRYAIGIDMPDFYCKRDARFWDDEVKVGKRVIRLNRQAEQRKPTSLQTIPAGDAYYALQALKEEYTTFDDYQWLNESAFLDAWRKLFDFRNRVAHIGHLISQEELEEAFGWFEVFLKYMPDIVELKKELSPDGMFDDDAEEPAASKASHQPDVAKNEKPAATPEVFARMRWMWDNVCDSDIEEGERLHELTQLNNKYSLYTIIFEGDNGKKGMRHVDGHVMVPALYDDFVYTYYCLTFSSPAIPTMLNGKFGLVKCDGTGAQVTDFVYDSISNIPWVTHAFFYRNGGSIAVGLLSDEGREICPCIIDKVYEPSNSCMIFKSGDYYGLFDLDKRVVMPMYDNIEAAGDPEDPLVFTLNGIPGYMDQDLKFVPKSEVDAIEDEDERYDRMLDFIPAEYTA